MTVPCVRTLIVSDLHLSPERGCGLFRSDVEFAGFLKWAQEQVPPARLVLAGDSLDFLVPEMGAGPLEPFDPEGAVRRVRCILDSHQEVFDGLGAIARTPGCTITWISGNHDPELAIPEVRAAVEDRLWLRSVPGNPIHWLVAGEAFRFVAGGATVLVAHGDLLDPWNWIDHERLQHQVRLHSRGLTARSNYRQPPGTRLVNEHALRLRPKHPWIDVLHPSRQAMYPILSEFVSPEDRWNYLDLLKTSAERVQYSWLPIFLDGHGPRRIEYAEPSREPWPRRMLTWLAGMKPPTSRYARLIDDLQVVAAEDDSADPRAPDETMADVERLITYGRNDLVILGHTHCAKSYAVITDRDQVGRPRRNGLYMNTGTWAELLRLPRSTDTALWESFLGDLERNQYTPERLPTFVDVSEAPDGATASASLREWTEPGIRVIDTRHFDRTRCAWLH